MDHGVERDVALELLLFLGGRQLAVEEEIGYLHEVAVLGKLLDGIAAVEELALVAVDEGDLGFAAARRGIAGIEGELVEFGIQVPDIDHLGTEGTREQRQLDRTARRIVGKGDGFLGGGRFGLGGGGFGIHRL
jgi:hypothetical protein